MVELLNEKRIACLEIRKELLREKCELYSAGIRNAGAPLQDCIGFVDCTRIQMARPSGGDMNQKSCFSGRKPIHCFIYQTLITPDGSIFALHGPIEGGRHDLTVLRKSGWNEILEAALLVDDKQYYVYGDGAYTLRPWFQRPFLGYWTTKNSF